jgi:hypothetical protein
MIFSAVHILITAAITGVLVAGVGVWRLARAAWLVAVAAGVLAAVAVAGWRLCANMGPLNDDGLPGFSANDLAAPIAVFVVLSVYADLRVPVDPRRYGQLRALATVVALVVNVITI